MGKIINHFKCKAETSLSFTNDFREQSNKMNLNIFFVNKITSVSYFLFILDDILPIAKTLMAVILLKIWVCALWSELYKIR